jgi:hypothetical protein
VEASLCLVRGTEPPHAPQVILSATVFADPEAPGVQHTLDLVRASCRAAHITLNRNVMRDSV